MSLKESISALRMLLPQRERRFRFSYGDYGDEAELVIDLPPHWDGRVPPPITMVALKGAWQAGTYVPDSTLGKQMLRGAEKETGLKLSFSKLWKRDKEGNAVRPVVVTGGTSRLHSLIPAFARA